MGPPPLRSSGTVTVTVPPPVTRAGCTVTQTASAVTAYSQTEDSPTPTGSAPPPFPKDTSGTVSPGAAWQPPACVTDTSCSPIVTVPVRAAVPVCSGTVTVTVPLPATLAGSTVIQSASFATG